MSAEVGNDRLEVIVKRFFAAFVAIIMVASLTVALPACKKSVVEDNGNGVVNGDNSGNGVVNGDNSGNGADTPGNVGNNGANKETETETLPDAWEDEDEIFGAEIPGGED